MTFFSIGLDIKGRILEISDRFVKNKDEKQERLGDTTCLWMRRYRERERNVKINIEEGFLESE